MPERLKYYPYWATYDIEVMLVSQQDLNNTEKLEWTQKHVPPVSVFVPTSPSLRSPYVLSVTAIPRGCWLRWWSTLRVSVQRLRPIVWRIPPWKMEALFESIEQKLEKQEEEEETEEEEEEEEDDEKEEEEDDGDDDDDQGTPPKKKPVPSLFKLKAKLEGHLSSFLSPGLILENRTSMP